MKRLGSQILLKVSNEFVDKYDGNVDDEDDSNFIEDIVSNQLNEMKQDDYTHEELLEIIDFLLKDSVGVLHQRILEDDDYVEYYYDNLYDLYKG